jgi:exodeoxyribonuclease V beta subunit
VTVLEASAGTGKTYAIAALAARYVAEGTPLDRLLLVTFTRMATGELRERVRERLVTVERGLTGALAGAPPGEEDVVRLLAAEDVARRRDRLRRALADFDAATIATTHGFCQEMLSGLGIAGDLEPDTEFVEDIRDLVQEVVDDLYVRRFAGGDKPPFRRAEGAAIAAAAIENPAVPIAPASGAVPEMRRRLACAARDELERRKRRMAVMTYDDLLIRLRDALDGHGAAERVRSRYDVVLVDEFQDTDPVQWEIVRRAFGDGGVTLVLVGDPKQAIYAFRGADVYAYLEAAESAGTHATLAVNRRSDQGLIDAYDGLFGGVKLGHEGIVYPQVRAADANQGARLTDAPHRAPLRFRVVRRDSVELTRKGYARAASAREHVARDVAGDLVELLSSPARVEGDPVKPRHVAVLVPKNRDAALVRDTLEAAGIPAVINGAGSVFATEPALEWLRLLEAIERPSSPTRAHAAALTCFFGWSAERVAEAGEDAWEEVHRRLHDWSRLLRVKGVASLTEAITLTERLPERILGRSRGERDLTDLRHVGQLLHAVGVSEQLGTTALTAWLRRRIAEAAQDTGDEERSRRLESDAEAVQVLTIHRSKGLEFPVVYLPFLWDPGPIPREREPVSFHDGGLRTIDVALEGQAFREHRDQHVVEQRGEELRLAYVALTRARHQAVVWWAPTWDSRNSPLGRLLFARDAEGNVAPFSDSVPDDAAAVARFEALAAAAPGCIAVERSTLGMPGSWSPPLDEPVELATAVFDRSLDTRWRRTSFSAMTAGTYEARVASEPEETVVSDEPETPAPLARADRPRDGSPSLLADMPVGVEVGTLVHRVLEATDFAAADLDASLAAALAAAQARRAVEIGDAGKVVAGLRAAIETPLGPLLGGLRLRDVGRRDRIDELEFELPLAGGDEPVGRVLLDAIGAALRRHLDLGDPLAGYADRLDDPALHHDVRGYLTGSLDLVVRVAGERFAVVDYKTNWLGPPDAPLTAWHYRGEALAAEMQRSHYGLQALLYTTALHRYLRWRLPGYDAERNLAGVLYLFVRGMSGADTSGIFAWRPSRALVEDLSDVLDGAVVA